MLFFKPKVKRGYKMLNVIIKLESAYLIWSVSDKAPKTHAMTKTDLLRWVEDNEGQDGVDAFDARVNRADEKGSSSVDYPAKDLLADNRAGDNGESLNEADLIKAYGIHAPHNKRFKLHKIEDHQDVAIVDDNNLYSINNAWRIAGSSIKAMIFVFVICLVIQGIDYLFYPLKNVALVALALEMYILGLLSSAKLTIWKKKNLSKEG